ncbi:hypothetical protein VULLAG_LOCUS2921 [Vulpes lagopus]
MEVPGPPVASKPGETSVKWQLCYDVTAKMWWMVSGAPRGTSRDPWVPGSGGAADAPPFPGCLQNGERWAQGGKPRPEMDDQRTPVFHLEVGPRRMSWFRRAVGAASPWQVGREVARLETLQGPVQDSCRPPGILGGWGRGTPQVSWPGLCATRAAPLPVSAPPAPEEGVDALQHPPLRLSTLLDASRESDQGPQARVQRRGRVGRGG